MFGSGGKSIIKLRCLLSWANTIGGGKGRLPRGMVKNKCWNKKVIKFRIFPSIDDDDRKTSFRIFRFLSELWVVSIYAFCIHKLFTIEALRSPFGSQLRRKVLSRWEGKWRKRKSKWEMFRRSSLKRVFRLWALVNYKLGWILIVQPLSANGTPRRTEEEWKIMCYVLPFPLLRN